MKSKALACAVTMVRDDYFFLEKWVRYYGEQFGRDALYVINHGNDARISDIAAGCNVIGLPGVFSNSFDRVRWRLIANLANGLRGYYQFVVCGDVDEFVAMDPATGMGLLDFLAKRRKRFMTITPVGLDLVHLPDKEPDPLGDAILGPRRFCRFNGFYSKPCVFNRETRLSRGGHWADDAKLRMLRGLYLFHMRFADAGLYADTRVRRSEQLTDMGVKTRKDTVISGHWFIEPGRDDPYSIAAGLQVKDDFDFTEFTGRMEKSWKPRGEGGLFGFKGEEAGHLNTIPDRFFGLV